MYCLGAVPHECGLCGMPGGEEAAAGRGAVDAGEGAAAMLDVICMVCGLVMALMVEYILGGSSDGQ